MRCQATLDGRITSWNPAAEKLFGYTAQEAIGEPMVKLFPPKQAEDEKQILARIGRGEGIDHYETQRVRKDGKLMDVAVTISPLRDHSGRVVGASTIARDITEQKHADEEMRQQAGLLDLAPALVRDMENHIVLWTRGAELLYAYTKDEALGRASHELFQTSGYINTEDQEKAGRLGIRAILTKPVDTKELLRTLAELFQRGAWLGGNLSS
jgi:PAS domain S-box-containing protein